MRMRQGLTLVELAVSLAVAAIVMATVYSFMATAPTQMRYFSIKADVQARGYRTMYTVTRLLSYAEGDSVVVSTSGSLVTLDFKKQLVNPGSHTSGTSGWRTLGVAYAADDPDNDQDDNGNGLIDECFLYYLDDQATEHILTGNVLEGSFQADLDAAGDYVDLRFQLAVRYEFSASRFTQTADTTGFYPSQDGYVIEGHAQRIAFLN